MATRFPTGMRRGRVLYRYGRFHCFALRNRKSNRTRSWAADPGFSAKDQEGRPQTLKSIMGRRAP